MKQGLLTSSRLYHTFPLFFPLPVITKHLPLKIHATLEPQEILTAKERRQLRNERREAKAASTPNWRETVEDRLLVQPKKRRVSMAEERNLDYLSLLGPQWWIVRVSRVSSHDTANRLARLLARNFPQMDFQVYIPTIQVKKKLKNGSISVKPQSLFPGCLFLRCVLNREIHSFIRECEGVGGFVGAKVGDMRREINKPRPVDDDDVKAIFLREKEEQVKADQDFEKEQLGEGTLAAEQLKESISELQTSVASPKPKRRSKKAPGSLGTDSVKDVKLLTPGATVRVVSGTFTEFSGILKKLNRRTKKATVGFSLFGKENLVDFDLNDILLETNNVTNTGVKTKELLEQQ